eukprot:3583152-Rhodomonas_salina.1
MMIAPTNPSVFSRWLRIALLRGLCAWALAERCSASLLSRSPARSLSGLLRCSAKSNPRKQWHTPGTKSPEFALSCSCISKVPSLRSTPVAPPTRGPSPLRVRVTESEPTLCPALFRATLSHSLLSRVRYPSLQSREKLRVRCATGSGLAAG